MAPSSALWCGGDCWAQDGDSFVCGVPCCSSVQAAAYLVTQCARHSLHLECIHGKSLFRCTTLGAAAASDIQRYSGCTASCGEHLICSVLCRATALVVSLLMAQKELQSLRMCCDLFPAAHCVPNCTFGCIRLCAAVCYSDLDGTSIRCCTHCSIGIRVGSPYL